MFKDGKPVVGGFGGESAVAVNGAGLAVAGVPGVAVDDHGVAVGEGWQVVLAAPQQGCPGRPVVGVGDQVGAGGGESVPDPVQQVLGPAWWEGFGDVDAGGQVHPFLDGDHDDEGLLGSEPDQVGHELGEVAGFADVHVGDVVGVHSGSPSPRRGVLGRDLRARRRGQWVGRVG